jgi:thioredoxin reductase
MANDKQYDVIIVGGSYAGLSAAMTLGRSMRNVLVIDSGKPCNRFTPHAHNFITHDGTTPAEISAEAKRQVLLYDTVTVVDDLALTGHAYDSGFEITTEKGKHYQAKKLLFATGITDILPAIEGIEACWGKSVLHCPYCHGYEVRNKQIAILSNGDVGYETCKHLSNWSSDVTLFTNGKSTLSQEQFLKLKAHNIAVVENEIASVEHEAGYMNRIVFKDGSQQPVDAMFTVAAFSQHCPIPEQLGCKLDEHGRIETDEMRTTSIPGVYAAGDNSGMFRALAGAIAAGCTAGAAINRALISEAF